MKGIQPQTGFFELIDTVIQIIESLVVFISFIVGYTSNSGFKGAESILIILSQFKQKFGSWIAAILTKGYNPMVFSKVQS